MATIASWTRGSIILTIEYNQPTQNSGLVLALVMQRGVVMVNTYDYSLNLGQIISSAYLSFYNYCMFYSQKFKQVIEDVL